MNVLTTLSRPAAGEARGSLVLLHGRGADEHDLFGLFDVLDPRQRLDAITVGAPLRLPPGGKHWYTVHRIGYPDPETFKAAYDALATLLDEEMGLDWSRTIIGGFSQGTAMSCALALGAGRPRPAGLLALSGFIPTVEGFAIDIAAGLPVFMSHGVNDPVISVDFARSARDVLLAAGADVDYHEHPGAHHIDPRQLPLMAAWLAERQQ